MGCSGAEGAWRVGAQSLWGAHGSQGRAVRNGKHNPLSHRQNRVLTVTLQQPSITSQWGAVHNPCP